MAQSQQRFAVSVHVYGWDKPLAAIVKGHLTNNKHDKTNLKYDNKNTKDIAKLDTNCIRTFCINGNWRKCLIILFTAIIRRQN